jgi:mannose-6-phosphate isomerase-like protein (cupin superfamily)
MQHFNQQALVDSMQGNPIEYLEFLRVTSLSSGIYHLAAGSGDPQKPHEEDEIYFVLEGVARFTSGGEPIDLAPGSILFVADGERHKFHDITEDLTLLVFFGAN